MTGMNNAHVLADRVRKLLPNVKRGSLRFWGNWFGRPHDNYHTLIRCEGDANVLKLFFDEGETLSVWSPLEMAADRSQFRINSADRVRWEWFYYGRPKTVENLFFEDFVRAGQGVAASTNVNWYSPDLTTDLSLPAVEIL
jgi:hypothetical protein